MSLPVFEPRQIHAVMDARRAVAAMRDAFRADGQGRTVVPSVINLAVPGARGEFHVKTALIEGVAHVAVKIASGFYDNPARGLPSGSGVMMLFDAATGFPSALLLDNGFLTDVRTGAAGAVAADYLVRRDAATAGVLGSGVQARWQVACLREVRPVARLVAWSPTRERLDRYCADMREQYGLETHAAASVEAVCREADVLITATPAREALVRPEWLRPGLHVTAVGSDAPGKQELDPRCFERADLIVCDRLAQCAAFGEIHHALAAGLLREADVQAELGEIVAGKKPGRTRVDQITIADLTGVGFQDTAIASVVFAALRSQTDQRRPDR